MNIGIIGSRRRNTEEDFNLLIKKFEEIYNKVDSNIIIVSGGCKQGGDRFAELIAEFANVEIIIHYPDKSSLPENPKRWDFARINFERNTLIARDSDILIALVAPDRTGGTEDTIRKFQNMYPNKEVILL